VQFLHQFQHYWTQQSQTVLSQHLANAPFLSNLGGLELQSIRADLIQLVNQSSTEIIGSFQHSMLQIGQGNEQRTTSGLSATEASSGLYTNNATSHNTQPTDAPALSTDLAQSVGISDPYGVDPTFNNDPPHPNLSFLELLNEIAPTVGIDSTWAPEFPMDDRLTSAPSSNFPDEIHAVSGFNSQLLSLGFEQSGTVTEPSAPESHLFAEQTSPATEDDWDLITRT
jgi:hypothetical protein